MKACVGFIFNLYICFVPMKKTCYECNENGKKSAD